MSPEERNLITNLFDRIRDAGAIDKDRQAEMLIKDAVRQMPDAPYVLVQSVLLQENALAEAQARIEALQARVSELEAGAQPQSGGSFLGGARPLRPVTGSVPSVGAEPRPEPSRSVWGASRQAEPDMAPMRGPGPAYQPNLPPQMPAASGGGGFLRSAMAAAAGVAGGVLLSDSIRGMFGGVGGETHHSASSLPHYQDPSNNDPGLAQHADAGNATSDNVDDTSWADGSDDSMDA